MEESGMDDRVQRVVLQITEDMSLTEDMDDAEAMTLLDWGSTMARRLTLYTVEMQEEDADSFLEDQIYRLRKTIRRINSFIGSKLGGASVDDQAMKIGAIFEAAQDVPVLEPNQPDNMNQFAAQLSFVSASGTLNAILSRLAPEERETYE